MLRFFYFIKACNFWQNITFLRSKLREIPHRRKCWSCLFNQVIKSTKPMGITRLQAPTRVSLILDVEHLKKFHVFLFHESSTFNTWKFPSNFINKTSSIPPLKIHEWHFGWLLIGKKRKESEWTTFHGWNTFLDYISQMTFISSYNFINFHGWTSIPIGWLQVYTSI